MNNIIKTLIILSLPIILAQCIYAQVFPLDTVVYSGPVEKRINFVFLSDGYQENELDKFISDVRGVASYFFNQAPLMQYKNYFNVFAIEVPSLNPEQATRVLRLTAKIIRITL